MENIKTLLPIMFRESLWLIGNTIFYALVNIGKPRIRSVVVFIMNIAVNILVYLFAGHIFSVIYMYLSMIVYCTFSSKEKKLPVRFFYGIISCITLLSSEALAAFLLEYFGTLDVNNITSLSPEDTSVYQTTMMSSLTIVMAALSVIISFFHSENKFTGINRLMLAAPLQQLCTMFLLNFIISKNNIDIYDPFISALYAVSAVFGMIVNIVIIRTADAISQKQIEQQKNEFLEYYSKANAEYTTKTENNLREIRKIRHDFNNHLQIIKALIETDDTPNASDMISQLEEKYSGTEIHRYSENHILDIILGSTADICSKNNIKFTCECKIPKETEHQIDICSIVSNMLQNAYEAVLQNKDNKTIHFSATVQNSMIFLKCENSTEKPLKQKGSKILTTKSDTRNHGFGIEIIEHTAALYNGNVIIEHGDTLFSILVQLNMNTE